MDIQRSIEPYLFSAATTIEEMIAIAQYIGRENAVLHRPMFEIVDEAHPDGTGVLHPYMYEQLSAMGMPLELTDEALQIKKRFLQTHYPQLFNQYQPYIPEFQDEASRAKILRNKQYMDVYRASTPRSVIEKLITFYDHIKTKGLDFNTVLKECMDSLGIKLYIHLPYSEYIIQLPLLEYIISSCIDNIEIETEIETKIEYDSDQLSSDGMGDIIHDPSDSKPRQQQGICIRGLHD